MLYAADFRKIARDALSGRWAVAIGTSLVAGLLGASIFGGGGGGGGGSSAGSRNETSKQFVSEWLNTDIGMMMLPLLSGLVVALIIWVLAAIIIGGAATLGYAKFNLNLVDRKEARFVDLFSRFDCIGAGFCMQFLRFLFTFLWTLLLIIPGIIAAYRYSMTPYILTEHPDLGAGEAIRRSKEMMRGNKGRLFCLQLSFIGWVLLSILTLGIGLLWVKPYVEAAGAAFYRQVSGTVKHTYPDYVIE